MTEAQPRTLWQLGGVSDFDAPTLEALSGGAIARASDYDDTTQRLTGLRAGTGGASANRQNLDYQWDAAGNLQQRRDAGRNLTEAFSYDGLDRLTGSTLNGVANLSIGYDKTGNVAQKSDVGTYVYGDPAHPHAVTLAGAEKLAYDANGNARTRNGFTQAWTSYNLPKTLRRSGFEARFVYGPDRERWRQVATYQNGTETTHYVGALLEKEATTSTGLTYWRHYVPTPGGATIVVSRNSDGTASTTYVLPDHLGSSDALLDGAGATVANASFDPLGRRRGSDWSRTTPPDWAGIANTTRQGYTGHEMLDSVGMVHMNGRVYDPLLARFVSADPVIASLADSQSVNPYAYVGNRPLNATDPSGLCVDGCVSVAIIEFLVNSSVASLFQSILGRRSGLPPPPARPCRAGRPRAAPDYAARAPSRPPVAVPCCTRRHRRRPPAVRRRRRGRRRKTSTRPRTCCCSSATSASTRSTC